MKRKRPTDPDIAKVDKDTRQALNSLALQIAKGAEAGSPTGKFAVVLAALSIADFAGILDDLYAISTGAVAHARADLAERDEAARRN